MSYKPDQDFVVLPRDKLFEFFGKMALPPWTEGDGTVIGGNIDCAPIASEIKEWVELNDLSDVYITGRIDDTYQTKTIKLQDVTDRALLTELQRRLALGEAK